MALVMTDAFMRTALQDMLLHASAGPFSGPLDGLYVALFTQLANPPSADSVTADLTEAAYTGYARQPVVWSGVWQRNSDGAYVTSGSLLQFKMSDAVVPETIVGYALMSAITAGNVEALETLPVPVNLATTDDALMISVEFAFGGSNYGAANVITN